MSTLPERYACLYAKEFAAQAMLRLRPEQREEAVVIVQGEAPLQTVCSFNSKARAMGIARGMTRVELDTFSSIVVLPRSVAEETAARAALLECAGTFSPRIEDQSDTNSFLCVIDIAGTEMLFGPPQSLARTLLDRIKALGVIASVAVSANFHAAIALARGSRNSITVVPVGNEAAALSLISLSVLDLSDSRSEIFTLWGIRTLGALAALPEKELIARMGQDGKRLRQLALGEFPHLFIPIELKFSLMERLELDSPVEILESLLFVFGMMLEQLVMRATSRVLALAAVTAKLSLEGGGSHERIVRPALPTNDRQLWIKLLHLDMEAHPPQAAILAVELEAEPGFTSKVQLGLFSPQIPESTRLDVTLARIRAIVGDECVGKITLKDTHRPDSFRIEPFTVPTKSVSLPAPDHSVAALRQLRPAQRVTVTVRDQLPWSFHFREKRYEVEHAYGPWRANGDWWNPTLWTTEQWDVIARSGDEVPLCCCLVRDQQSWQVVALYD